MSSTTQISIGQDDFAYVRDIVRRHSAVVLDAGKEWFVESRLAPLAEGLGLESAGELIARARVRPSGSLHREVIEALMTNETLFFRDYYPFDALRRVLLPQLMETRASERRINFWSAACSSGQEPYSVGMLIRDGFPSLAEWNVQILATDISSSMVARAKVGEYNQIEMNRGLPAAMLVRYFEQQSKHWRIGERIRRMVDFRVMNLAEPWPSLPSMDVVFLRNVLMYFDQETKKAILEKVRRLLRPDGWLLLGSAETTLNIHPAFEPVKIERAICYRLRK